ncbi:MAG: hypothetical protein KF744_03590 [Taibaiella sp.]|nr:hypothetical protein [Taibaiella sp.]
MLRELPKILLAVLLCASLIGCKQRHHVISPSFYYWKTTYELTAYEKKNIAQLGVKQMYLRLFDVDTDPRATDAYPVGLVRVNEPVDSTIQYIPVIFVTQRTLNKLSLQRMTALAHKMANLAEVTCSDAGIKPREIQIDCDWTATTREKYFRLLSFLKKEPYFADKLLSCTIRLHQVKYTTSSGIPPVDRGAVMCYNVGNLKKPGTQNSILEAELAEKYLSHMDSYPLPFDIALPLFSWSLLFRGGQFVGILRDVDVADIRQSKLFRKTGDGRWACKLDTMWRGQQFFLDDIVRFEASEQADLMKVARHTAQHVHNDSLRVIFFSCDSITLSKHSVHDLEEVLDCYR